MGSLENSNMSLAMKKYAHTFSILILQGRNRGDGHTSATILCVCVGTCTHGLVCMSVCVCMCIRLHVCICLRRPSLNGSVFIYPQFVTMLWVVTIVILMIQPLCSGNEKGHACHLPYLIYAVLNRLVRCRLNWWSG